jgi:hypothetical protein
MGCRLGSTPGDESMNDNLQSILRAILTSLAGGLVASGYLDAAQLQVVIGAVLALFSVGWSIYSNHQTRAANVVAAATGTPIVVPLIGTPTVTNAVPTKTGAADVAKVTKQS